MSAAEIRAGRRRIEISHPDKVLFPASGVTKLDLACHYTRVARAMVPHVRDHPVAMQCFPGGIERKGFFMKNVPDYFPDWVPRAELEKRGGRITHALPNDPPTLAYLANQNCVTVHVWTSRADRPRHPDRAVFDLDPPGDGSFADVRAAARALGDLLRDAGLEPFAMTTGSRGLHVVAPIRRELTFVELFPLLKGAARRLEATAPSKLTVEWSKAKRGGRIFIDIRRNAYAQHAVAPYAARPRPAAPVAAPLHWDELGDRRLRPDGWTIATIGDRLEAEGDPWRDMARARRAAGPALRRLAG
jgi:bifunctional non-homologous end joining protein LigD